MSAFSDKPNRIYVLPDYKTNRHVQGNNIYHVKNTFSDLKCQNFTIASLELKNEQLTKELNNFQQERENY